MKSLARYIEKPDDFLRVVAFMSGSGTNLVKIIEYQEKLLTKYGRYLYKVVGILTDNPSSNAYNIGSKYNISVETNDISAFYKSKGLPRRDLSAREEFDRISLEKIAKYQADIIVLAGYMSILTPVIIKKYLTINVHPADLSIKDELGKRKYTGAHAVRDAILSGERTISSSTHIVEEEVDGGRLLIISRPIDVILPDGFNPSNRDSVRLAEQLNQNRLKEYGDWIIFPLTLEYIALGYFEVDEKSNLFFKGTPIPEGLRL
jgi:folate-dependent phosphoribosylglycinamide formyltransferase PurN